MSVNLNLETKDPITRLLELAAKNDFEGFKKCVDHEPSIVNCVGLWRTRQKGSNQTVLTHRTPLMVAATYGSIDVVKQIISSPRLNVNRLCGTDCSTPLHCAASSGSEHAVEIVKLLLAAGANPDSVDADGHRPIDVIFVPKKFQQMKHYLEMLLSRGTSAISNPNTKSHKYPSDPSWPDIKSSIYSTDEFRMFSYKVRLCHRLYLHDWTECPFVHPGETARRRDPRKYHYSCLPCKKFRKGACPRGEMCEFAHGTFESFLHPTQYRTRFCRDGMSCSRKVCFFAHTQEELRPSSSSNMQNLLSAAPDQGQQSLLVPSKTYLSPRNAHYSLLQQAPFGLPSPRRISLDPISSMSDDRAAMIAQVRSLLSSCDLESNAADDVEFGKLKRCISLNLLCNREGQLDSPRNTDHSLPTLAPFGLPSLAGSIPPDHISPISDDRVAMTARFRRLSSRDHGSNAIEYGKLKRCIPPDLSGSGEDQPDVLWVWSIFEESEQSIKENPGCGAGENSNA